jgi:nucleoid-associated protein YejK
MAEKLTELAPLQSDPEIGALLPNADAVLEKYRTTPPLPDILYHYTSLDAAIAILQTRKMRCSNVVYANDPAEATYGQSVLDEVAKTDPTLKLQGLRSALAELDSYIVSFSGDGDLLPQWRAYCRNGRGVSVGVDAQVLRRRPTLILARVIYDSAEQRQFVTDMMDVFRQPLLSARGNTVRLRHLLDTLGLYLVIVRSALKSQTYESEREYRLFDVLPADRSSLQTHLAFRASGGMVVPYFEADLSASKAENATQPFSEVRVGPCLDATLIERSLKTLAIQEGLTFAVKPSAVKMRCE